MSSHIGEITALLTAFFWTITALSFESASKKVGSIAVNLIRLLLAFLFLSTFTLFYRGMLFPIDASTYNWFWLFISGLVGFVFGDLFLFKSYTIIGARVSMLIMTLVPPITALVGWLVLGETLTVVKLFGMFLTICGIALVILNRSTETNKLKLSLPLKGILYAIGGTLGQAFGLILSKYGMKDYDAFAATQIRIIAGIIGFSLVVVVFKRIPNIKTAIVNKSAMIRISVGSFFGPFLGVSFSLFAIQHTSTGIASTLMAIVPILIIAPSVILFKQKVTVREIVGALISVCGVILFFI